MAKKDKASAMPSMPMPETPPNCIRMTKEQAKNFTIGDKAQVTVSGEVQSIRKTYSDDNAYEVELKNSKVSNVDMNPAASALKSITGK